MNTLSKYTSLVKFSHTIFAMPFALMGYVYGVVSSGVGFEWLLLLKIVLCMVFARNAAMGFNRWADRDIDTANPRTSQREIPAGKISARKALWFVVANSALFILCAAFINNLTFALSPIALFIILGYSYTKRFTQWSHLVLGVALSIAPVGGYMAVTGELGIVSVLLAGLVLTWVGGFDIIYSLQDTQFDRANNLHSIPAHHSVGSSILISIALHLVSIYAVVIIGLYYAGGIYYWIGAGLFIAILVVQHILARPSQISKIGSSFTLINGLASITYAGFSIADFIL